IQPAGRPRRRDLHGLVRVQELPAGPRELSDAVDDPAWHVHDHRAAVGSPDRAIRHRAGGQRLAERLRRARGPGRPAPGHRMSNGALIVLMCLLFLGLGYAGVPVAFALIAGVLVATAFTPVSFPSMIGQLFHGIDSETL